MPATAIGLLLRHGIGGMLMIAASVCLTIAVADDQCHSSHIDETVSVKSVIDGDTVRLSNGKLVRFIGINAPEIDHEGGQSQPLAISARDAVSKLIGPERRIAIQYGEERQDRHGRLLAHLYTLDGVNIQQQLLRQGLAFWIVVPPNIAAMECYRAAEIAARKQQAGLWRERYFSVKSIASLDQHTRGFVMLSGVIHRVGHGKNNIWLNLTDDTKNTSARQGLPYGKFALRIHRSDLHYFQDMMKDGVSDLSNWQGKRVTARGWIYADRHNSKAAQPQLLMQVKHPAALEFEPAP